MARRVGISVPIFKRKKRKILSFVSHYSYGAATGALYGVLSKDIPFHPAITGSLYGLFVWTGSYLGWLPATGLWNPKRESKGRRFSMIAAHVVWGASMGLIHSVLKTKLKKTRGSVYVTSQQAA
jgi:putative membrane protein